MVLDVAESSANRMTSATTLFVKRVKDAVLTPTQCALPDIIQIGTAGGSSRWKMDIADTVFRLCFIQLTSFIKVYVPSVSVTL